MMVILKFKMKYLLTGPFIAQTALNVHAMRVEVWMLHCLVITVGHVFTKIVQ